MPVELVINIENKENYNSLLKDSRSVAKYQCMIDNDVEILSGEFFAPLLKKYPKRFFKKFREN